MFVRFVGWTAPDCSVRGFQMLKNVKDGYGLVGSGAVRCGKARQAWCGSIRLDLVRHGMAGTVSCD